MESLKQELQQKEDKKKANYEAGLREQLETEALTKLKLGKRMTWAEFKVLAEEGEFQSEQFRKLKEKRKHKLK